MFSTDSANENVLYQGEPFGPFLALGVEVWLGLWQLHLPPLTRQQDMFYSLAPPSADWKFKGTPKIIPPLEPGWSEFFICD